MDGKAGGRRRGLGFVLGLVLVMAGCSRAAERTESPDQRALPRGSAEVARDGGASPGPEASKQGASSTLGTEGTKRGDRRTWLVAGIAPAQDADMVAVHPLRVGPGGVSVAKPVEASRLPGEREWALAQALSCRGDGLMVARGNVLMRRQPFVRSAEEQAVTLEEPATALLNLGQTALVGGQGRVQVVDFSRTPPRVSLLHDDNTLHKPVDFILELGRGRVLAVDDVVLPKVGFVFHRFPDDRLRFQFKGDLPSGPNERYVAAIADGNRLVLASRFGTRTGYGSRLYTCTVGHDAVQCDSATEMVAFRSKEAKLLAGDTFSWWRGVALVSGRVFLAAGRRGILMVEGEKALEVGPRGACLDLVGLGDQVLALVAFGGGQETDTGLHGSGDSKGGQRVLAVLIAWDSSAGRLVERWRSPVPSGIERLQR